MAANKKRAYTARDYEDMVKIELDDAIAAERKKAGDLVGITDEEWESLTKKVIEAETKTHATIQVDSEARDIAIKSKGKTYTRRWIRLCDGERTQILEEAETKPTITINVDNFTPAAKKAAEGEIKRLLKRATDVVEDSKLLGKLKSKRADYANLAARFRLGYTGDPTDLDSINKKCKEYLLKGTI